MTTIGHRQSAASSVAVPLQTIATDARRSTPPTSPWVKTSLSLPLNRFHEAMDGLILEEALGTRRGPSPSSVARAWSFIQLQPRVAQEFLGRRVLNEAEAEE